MTDTPITRAARRMALIESGTDCFDQLDEAMQERLRESVRAVLEAVREPAEASIEAGAGASAQSFGDWHSNDLVEAGVAAIDAEWEDMSDERKSQFRMSVKPIWRAMIDAAIAEK